LGISIPSNTGQSSLSFEYPLLVIFFGSLLASDLFCLLVISCLFLCADPALIALLQKLASPTESKSTAASINQLLPKPKSLAERGTASTKPARALGIDGNILLTSDEVSTKLKEKEKKKKEKEDAKASRKQAREEAKSQRLKPITAAPKQQAVKKRDRSDDADTNNTSVTTSKRQRVALKPPALAASPPALTVSPPPALAVSPPDLAVSPPPALAADPRPRRGAATAAAEKIRHWTK
jgi:hypothetical protein